MTNRSPKKTHTPLTISEFIRQQLQKSGLSQHDVERRSGGRITNSYLSKLLSGAASNLTVEKLKALADGLGVTHAEIADIAFNLDNLAQDPEEAEFFSLLQRYKHLSPEQKLELRALLEMVDHEIDRRQRRK